MPTLLGKIYTTVIWMEQIFTNITDNKRIYIASLKFANKINFPSDP